MLPIIIHLASFSTRALGVAMRAGQGRSLGTLGSVQPKSLDDGTGVHGFESQLRHLLPMFSWARLTCQGLRFHTYKA